MAKTPPPDYVALTAPIDGKDCRECRNDIFDAIGEKVSWKVLTVLLAMCVAFFTAVGVKALANGEAISTGKAERDALKETVKEIKETLREQSREFSRLADVIRRKGIE